MSSSFVWTAGKAVALVYLKEATRMWVRDTHFKKTRNWCEYFKNKGKPHSEKKEKAHTESKPATWEIKMSESIERFIKAHDDDSVSRIQILKSLKADLDSFGDLIPIEKRAFIKAYVSMVDDAIASGDESTCKEVCSTLVGLIESMEGGVLP